MGYFKTKSLILGMFKKRFCLFYLLDKLFEKALSFSMLHCRLIDLCVGFESSLVLSV